MHVALCGSGTDHNKALYHAQPR